MFLATADKCIYLKAYDGCAHWQLLDVRVVAGCKSEAGPVGQGLQDADRQGAPLHRVRPAAHLHISGLYCSIFAVMHSQKLLYSQNGKYANQWAESHARTNNA